jgi:hypothetical protein
MYLGGLLLFPLVMLIRKKWYKSIADTPLYRNSFAQKDNRDDEEQEADAEDAPPPPAASSSSSAAAAPIAPPTATDEGSW